MPPDRRHVHPVEWIQTELPRTAFEQDLLYSLGAYMTVCRISRNNAEQRVNAILEGKTIAKPIDEAPEAEESDIEQIAQDQIREFINRRFKGHDLARLVDAILQIEGYVTQVSEPGPDGGVDILAGKGSLGFDSPKICVQVKSGRSPLDVTELRKLQGSVQTFGAEQGLLVSWSGFKRSLLEESRQRYFNIRLWDSTDILNALFKNYNKLSTGVQTELPLKRIWALVLEEEQAP